MPMEADSIDEFAERAMRFNPRRNEETLRESLKHNLRRTADGKWAWKWDPRAAPPGPSDLARRAETLWSDVEAVRCPVLVVRGGRSNVLGDASASEFADRFADGRWVTIEGAGHTVQGDRPAQLAGAIRDFLADVLAGGDREEPAP
jgi:pimeloyl-ACP methyl ester carboxylesterase